MVFKCSAPNCRGNYKNSEKVSVFQFPADEDLKKKWVNALKRKDFTPTKNSRVCEKHFKPDDILKETSFYDERTARLLTAPLQFPRLKEGAIPSIVLNCPKDLSQANTSKWRKSIDDQSMLLEQEHMQRAIQESERSRETYLEEQSFHNFAEFLSVLDNNTHFLNPNNDWVIIKETQSVAFYIIKKHPNPKIMVAVVVSDSCDVRVFTDSIELPKINKYDLPYHLESINQLDQIMQFALKLGSSSSSSSNFYINVVQDVFKKVMDLVPAEQKKRIEFLLEQIMVVLVVLSFRK